MNPVLEEMTLSSPPITIDSQLYDRLLSLATTGGRRWPEAASLLLREIERATVTPDDQVPENVVTIGSRVTFEDRRSGRTRAVTLVFPEDADIGKGRVSVLTPIGAALIGLACGQSIQWVSNAGVVRDIAVTAVAGLQKIV